MTTSRSRLRPLCRGRFGLPVLLLLAIIQLAIHRVSGSELFVGGGSTQADQQDVGTTYGVIVDCGSSGTRANLYHWSNSLIYPALLNDIEPMREPATKTALSLKKQPGLSSMKDEPEKSSDYMEEIMKFITENIPRESQSATGVYIMATAGMRLLDKEIQQQIMADIAKDITKRYNFAKVKTNVISGAQEGMYQWISVNSKAKRFAPAMEAGKQLDGKKTYALIEMGGASIQVAYQLQPHLGRTILQRLPKNVGVQPAYMSQIVEPNISQETQGHKYELHSTTFLGLGSNSARDNYLDMLIKPGKRFDERLIRSLKKKFLNSADKRGHQKQPVIIKDPCMPRGSSEERSKPKRMLSRKESKTIGFIEEEGEEMFKVKVVGTGNYAGCRKKVSNFLKLCKSEGLHCEPNEPCTMHLLGTPFVPFEAYQFLGLGEFYYTTMSMMKLDGVYQHDAIVQKTREMCELTIEQLETKYPDANKFDEDRSRTECFKAVFADTFLTEGLMMPLDYRNLTTVGKIGKDSIDWTLGAVLDKSLTIELAAEENSEEEDDDDFEDYEEFENFEDADDEEEDAEVRKALADDDDNLVVDDALLMEEADEKPVYEHPASEHTTDEQANFEMSELLAEAETDIAKIPSKVSSAGRSFQGASRSVAGETPTGNQAEHDLDLAELEQAEGFHSRGNALQLTPEEEDAFRDSELLENERSLQSYAGLRHLFGGGGSSLNPEMQFEADYLRNFE